MSALGPTTRRHRVFRRAPQLCGVTDDDVQGVMRTTHTSVAEQASTAARVLRNVRSRNSPKPRPAPVTVCHCLARAAPLHVSSASRNRTRASWDVCVAMASWNDPRPQDMCGLNSLFAPLLSPRHCVTAARERRGRPGWRRPPCSADIYMRRGGDADNDHRRQNYIAVQHQVCFLIRQRTTRATQRQLSHESRWGCHGDAWRSGDVPPRAVNLWKVPCMVSTASHMPIFVFSRNTGQEIGCVLSPENHDHILRI